MGLLTAGPVSERGRLHPAVSAHQIVRGRAHLAAHATRPARPVRIAPGEAAAELDSPNIQIEFVSRAETSAVLAHVIFTQDQKLALEELRDTWGPLLKTGDLTPAPAIQNLKAICPSAKHTDEPSPNCKLSPSVLGTTRVHTGRCSCLFLQ